MPPRSLQNQLPSLFVLFLLHFTLVSTQNPCAPSSTNDKIFVGSSTITSGILKPGINTFSMTNGIIETLAPLSTFNSSKLQIAQSTFFYQSDFRNFASSVPNAAYQMKDFSFHSVFLSPSQIRFLFLWNEISTINVTVSLSIQFLLTYDREEFLMGNFVIELNQTSANYSRTLHFKDLNPASVIPNWNSLLSINLFIVGLRYLGQGINVTLVNESYNLSSSELSFTIQGNSNSQGLYLLHLSYVIFDRIILAPEFKMFFSWDQLLAQDKIDYWMQGVKAINFQDFQSGNIPTAEFYFYKINRFRCSQNCSGCVSVEGCQKMLGLIVNDTDCVLCPVGTKYNSQNQKCEVQTSCRSTEIWNGTQCICKPGFFRVNSLCIQCPQNTTYNQSTQLCDLKCDQNSTLSPSNQCLCKLGYYVIDGKCSLCPVNTTYDATSKKCLVICSAIEVFNQTSQKCECIAGLYRINGLCGKCANGYTYNETAQTCIFNCGTNQTLVNGTCRCLDGFVIILGSCSKCPSGTIYNALLKNCTPACTGNRKILNGKCVCNDGTYEIGSQCGVCPQNSTYNNVSKTCETKISCRQNEVLLNGVCTCLGPYVSNVCQPCSTNLVWNSSLQECILKCPTNSVYNSTYKACVCSPGYFVIGDSCGVCPNGTVYDFSSNSCQNGKICTGANEIYYLGLCICNAGYFRIKDNCSTCPAGTFYNETIFDCQGSCGSNEVYNLTTSKCQCNSISGFFKINGTCQQCPSGTVYNSTSGSCQGNCPTGQAFVNGKCSCPNGLNLIGTACGDCDPGTTYNASTLKCDKTCSDPNSYFQNSKCFCYPPYVIVNQNACQLCPANTTYDLTTLSCKPVVIPPNNANLTCNTTTEIKKLNTSTGIYYCECDQSQKYFFIYDRCGTCQMFTKYNPDTKSCELDVSLLTSNNVFYFDAENSMKVGGSLSSSDCLAIDNKVFCNGVCMCVPSAMKYGNKCITCPANSSPNSQQSACQCNSGYELSKTDYTCRPSSTSAIRDSSGSCPVNEIWYINACSCIQDFYRINGTCTKCPIFSVFNGSSCVCQFGYFAQSLNAQGIPSTCQKCHPSCSSCTGTSISQCLSCANISSILKNGQCIIQNCSIGFYLVVYSANVSKCQKCSAYCKSCVSGIECVECIEGFSVYSYQLTPTLNAKVCSEICGDGKRFERNCDDGNLISGDGCSKDCEVQAGWACLNGTTNSSDVCSLTNPVPKAIIIVKNTTIQKGFINQNVRLSYIPDYFLKTDCDLCSNLFKITITSAKVVPDSIKVAFIPKSRYQFNIEFKFNDIFTVPTFKFGIQINPEYKLYFTEWDMAQWYELEVNSVLLSRKSVESYLREDEVVFNEKTK